jgi:NADPH:quinone reductase
MSMLQVSAFGGINKLVYTENDENVDAELDNDEVLVSVLVAGVNAIDTKIRQGSSFAAKNRGERFPWTIGFDMSGEVVKIPRGCKTFKKGDLVCGLIGFPLEGGAYCSLGKFKQSELVKIPKGCDVKSAGALPMAGLTAYQALFDVGHLKAGETVIISAAAGGVGHIAVQLAKKAGARVLAIGSKENHEFLKSIGADDVEEYHNDECLRWQSEADLVIDLVGGQSAISNLSLLKINSRMVSVPTITFQAVKLAASNLSSEVLGMVVKPNCEQLKYLLTMIANGELKVKISLSFFLKDGAKAHNVIEDGHALGKLILLPNGIIKENK